MLPYFLCPVFKSEIYITDLGGKIQDNMIMKHGERPRAKEDGNHEDKNCYEKRRLY